MLNLLLRIKERSQDALVKLRRKVRTQQGHKAARSW
jgi:hypothetical protein